MTFPPTGDGGSRPIAPIVVVLPALDLATYLRAIRLAMRPARYQRHFGVALVAALLALFVQLAFTGELLGATRALVKIVLLASASLLVFELLIVAAWRFHRSNLGPELLVAKEEGLACRRHADEVVPWRDVAWWQASADLLVVRFSDGALLVVPRRQEGQAAWESLRRVVAERVRHADLAESRIWILILVLFYLLVAIVVALIAGAP